MSSSTLRLDVVIFGGGAAGLWLLDDLTRNGYSAILLEANALGAGQTLASQGIIHGGLKYTLKGLFTSSADAIKDMPGIWRRCLTGQAKPDLSATPLRAEFCYLWSTEALKSRLGLFAASAALAVKPRTLPREQWPDLLQSCAGSVSMLDEQVISPAGFIAALAALNAPRLLRYDASVGGVAAGAETARDAAAENANAGASFELAEAGHVTRITLVDATTRQRLTLAPKSVVLTAGAGNAQLRRRLGLSETAMQRRPLHVALARGPLPAFNGHCVDGSKTRVTITTDHDAAGRTVWQIGGQVSEDGVAMSKPELIDYVKRELAAVLPGIALGAVEWATCRIDRAEGTTRSGNRPADAIVLREGNVVTCWPTKLALVPQAVAKIRRELPEPGGEAFDLSPLQTWPRPAVGLPPWELEKDWIA